MTNKKQQSTHNEVNKDQYYFVDRFDENRHAGKVIGHHGVNGIVRKGIDQEKIISIDNNALRIEPLLNEGWGRCGIAYGPYKRENGLTFAISLLNGHNTSQSGTLAQPFNRRMYEWLKGSEAFPLSQRIIHWMLHGRKRRTLRLWRRWWKIHNRTSNGQFDHLDENLALGWFPHEVPSDPRAEGNALIIHATGAENGELWARISDNVPPIIRGLQNLPIYYFVILREQGAAYYASSAIATSYLPAFPYMRPLGIDTTDDEVDVYAGLFQSVMGQIGFRADTRVRDTQVELVPEIATWYGTAQAADRLMGEGYLAESLSDTGDQWEVLSGQFQRTAQGTKSSGTDNLAVLDTLVAPGLIHLLISTGANTPDSISLIWRYQDRNNYWAWEFGEEGTQLTFTNDGEKRVVAVDNEQKLESDSNHSMQILDYGNQVRLFLDGKLVTNAVDVSDYLQDASKVGFFSQGENKNLFFHSIEIHPHSIPVPAQLSFSDQWTPPINRKVLVRDNFNGPHSDLAGRITPIGNRLWQKEIGDGVIELTGNGAAAVRASKDRPNPGRTAYTIPWDNVGFADLEIEFIPPGDGPAMLEKSRAGLIFFQDEDNYITVSTFLDTYYDGSSFAFFYHLNGFEELFDASWSNVGRTINWGTVTRARVIMDGVNFAVYLNDEAVLYRSLTDVYPDIHDFTLRRVGIVVNWEWGDDTGTVFNEFVAANKV